MRRQRTAGQPPPGRQQKVLPPRYSSYIPGASRRPALPAASPEPALKRSWLRLGLKFIIVLFIALFILVLVIGVWDARNISAASKKMFGSGSIFDLLSNQPLKGSDRGRVNVLMIGYSVDDPGHPAAKLTDSIMLISMNPATNRGYLLSIPRDLYVNIPGFGYAKINEAYADGGVKLLESVVETTFDQPIDYYLLLNYASVRDVVAALGGITVTIKSPDPRGLYDPNINKRDGGPLKLSNGPQELDGQTALNLTRARGDDYRAYGFPQADFDRTQHQRQVFTAIKDNLSWKLILNPRKNDQILIAFADNIKTDIAATEARSLFGLFNSIPSSRLQSVSLRALSNTNYLSSYTTPYGQSALVPAAGIGNYGAIVDALETLNRR